MTNNEHFTLDQVVTLAAPHKTVESMFYMTPIELHTLINAAINKRIGEPAAWKSVNGNWVAFADAENKFAKGMAAPTPLYTLKEIK